MGPTLAAVTTVILVRHGRTTANVDGVLAGWSPGVHLDDTGTAQAGALAERLRAVPLTHVVASPLERTLQTARPIAKGRGLKISRDRRLGECDYGDWTGRKLQKLAKDPLWPRVQAHPSAMVFPGGESMLQAQTRSVLACREWAARSHDVAGDQAVVAIVSHGDIIKSILADALGMHLDAFQRIVVDPGSVSVIRYTALRPFVERTNDTGTDLSYLAPKPPAGHKSKKSTQRKGARSATPSANSDAAIGGGVGSGGRHG